jgi:RND family efflux transporter MFP subunit
MRRFFGTNEEQYRDSSLEEEHRDERTGRFQLFLVLGFIIGAIVISSLLSSTNRAPRMLSEEEFAPLVETITVQPERRRIEIVGSGAVRSQVAVQLVPQVQGRVSALNPALRPGGSFSKDDVLFRIETDDYELAVERLKAEVASARTSLQLELAEGAAASREWEEINPGEPVPDLVARRPQSNDRRAALSAARANLADAQLDLDRTAFTLPFDGRIVSSNIDLGQYLSAGQSYGTVYSLDGLEVPVPLADRDLKWLQPLENVEVIVRSSYLGLERNYPATASRVAAELDAQTRFATVLVSLKSPEDPAQSQASLVPGVFVSVTFLGTELENVISVPTAAVQENGRLWTIVDGRLKDARPEIIQSGPNTTLVRGLPAGSTILTSGLSGAIDGMAVRTNTSNAPAAQQ